MAVTKSDMVEALIEKFALDKTAAKKLVDLFFEEIRATLASGEEVRLSGFGNFLLRDKNPRPGRNPKTGEAALISARRVVVFKSGPKWRELLQTTLK